MKKIRVAVGMSGGVDSAVAAYLLKKQGYEVIGIFMRNWDSLVNNDIKGNRDLNKGFCPQELDYQDALESAKIIGIELVRVDFVKEYWDYVFSSFINEYQKGRTPNPDINCNKFIKFDKLLNYAFNQLGVDFLATGHYARLINSNLYKGLDPLKDQSYFLAQLNKKQLTKILFPLGELSKEKVRQIAANINLNVASKKDSTGICFIGERKFDLFLENYIPSQPGDIVDIETNKVIGKHNGIMYYTIGQRKGLNLGGQRCPYFLAAKDIEKKIIYVAPEDKQDYLKSDSLIANDINILEPNFDPNNLCAKFRYRQADIKVEIEFLDDTKIKIKYEIQNAITPGQQLVIYENDKLILGAVIDKIFYQNKEKKVIW